MTEVEKAGQSYEEWRKSQKAKDRVVTSRGREKKRARKVKRKGKAKRIHGGK